MGFRFRKSISIIPGVRVNLSNSGLGLSLGPRGASVSVGRSGVYANLGLPGTGLSYRTRLDSKRGHSSSSDSSLVDIQSLQNEAARINGDMEWILNIHQQIPNPQFGRSVTALQKVYLDLLNNPYSVPAPERPIKPEPVDELPQPVRKKPSILSRLIKSDTEIENDYNEELANWSLANEQIRQSNAFKQQQYNLLRTSWAEQYAIWQSEKNLHEQRHSISETQALSQFRNDAAFFESVLGNDLSQIEWPRETIFSYEVTPSQSLVEIDVDLPEVEDIPTQIATINTRGINIKNKSDKTIRLEYARHIHGCLLKLAGETLSSLPFNTVNIAGFTQRTDPRTGRIMSEYIIACSFDRSQFLSLNFASLENIDPLETLSLFKLNRNMTSTGIFKSITP